MLTAKRNEVDGVVAVQASQEEVETRFLAELAKTHPLIKGVVGWIDLQADNIAERAWNILRNTPASVVTGMWCRENQTTFYCVPTFSVVTGTEAL